MFGLVEQISYFFSLFLVLKSLRAEKFDENYKRWCKSKNVTEMILIIKCDVKSWNKRTSWVIAIPFSFLVLCFRRNLCTRDSWEFCLNQSNLKWQRRAFVVLCDLYIVANSSKLDLIESNWKAWGERIYSFVLRQIGLKLGNGALEVRKTLWWFILTNCF